MESINSVDSLSKSQVNDIATKNALVDKNVITSKPDIIATAKLDPEEEFQKPSNEETNEKELQGSIEKEKDGNKYNNKQLNISNNSVNISNSLTENIINEDNDNEENVENDDDKTEKSLVASLNNNQEKEDESQKEEKERNKRLLSNIPNSESFGGSEKNLRDRINIQEEDEEENKEDERKSSLPKDNRSNIPNSESFGGSENILVNKIINKIQEQVVLGSVDSLSKRKLHMNKKFEELRASQADLDRTMSHKSQLYKKNDVNNMSDNSINIKKSKLSFNSDDEKDDNDDNDNESFLSSSEDEIFDIEMIRKFEKRNTIHVPLHKRNYANITSSYLRSSFLSVSITDGIEKTVVQLFDIIEENVKPILQCDDMSKIFLKAVNTVASKKEEEDPDFDITTISKDVGKLIKEYKFVEAYDLISHKVNNNYRVQIIEEVLTTINSIIVLFCLEERVQNEFRNFYVKNYRSIDRDSLLEIMNTVDFISPPENIILGYCIYYLINSKNKKLAPETYKELANALYKNGDYNYALRILDDMGRQHWDKLTYQTALDLCIKTKPQKLQYAESLLNDYGKPYITVKNENSLVPMVISTPLMIGTTKQDIKTMRSYYKELLRVFKWKNALDDFETAKNAIYTKKEMLQLKNAMLELCVTYKEFQHGWSIFQGMTECNKLTAQVAITLCREAINYYNEANEQDTYRIGWVNRAWDIVISLKDWAIYNMPMIQEKRRLYFKKPVKRSNIEVPEVLYNKLKVYKVDKYSENDEEQPAEPPVVEMKKRKSIFQSSKPVELPKHLAQSNFNLTNIDRKSMISILAFVLHEILCIFETIPNMEIFLLHVIEVYNFLNKYNITEILCDEYLIRPILRYCLKCRLGEKYKKFNLNHIPTDPSFLSSGRNSISIPNSDPIQDEELKANIEKMGARGRTMSINKNQQMNDILFEHIRNKLKRRATESTPADPEFEKEKNDIVTRIAVECYYNICGGNSEKTINKCHSNTYAIILHFAILESNVKLFQDICNNLWYARIQLDEEVVMALQLFHDFHIENCSSCEEKDHFYSAEVTVQPYKYEKQKFIVLNGIRMRTPLDLSFLKKIGIINGRPYSQEEARKFLNHCINACDPKRRLSMSL